MSLSVIQLGPFSRKQTGGIIQSASEFGFDETIEFSSNHRVTTIGKNKVYQLIRTYSQVLYLSHKSRDFTFIYQATSRGLCVYLPLILIIKYLYNPKIIIRKFAGDFDVQLRQSLLLRIVFGKILNSIDVLYLETNYLVNYFQKIYGMNKVRYWPNTREIGENKAKVINAEVRRKLVFLSRVSVTKGIVDLLEVMPELSKHNFVLEVYGPLIDVKLKQLNVDNVKYGGNLKSPSQITSALKKNDILILPSRYKSEGYPGAIIEALQLGIPIIVSDWRSLPELIGDAGVVLKKVTATDIKNAVDKISQNYLVYTDFAKARGQDFSTHIVNKRIVEEICSL